MKMKACKTCGEVKPLEDFVPGKRNTDGREPTCKACRNAQVRARLDANQELRDRDNARRKRWHQTHYRYRRYGLTQDQYDAIWAAQGEKCSLCGGTEAGRGWEWCIDHCHTTNRVRGILCHPCNTALGYFERLAADFGIERLAEYLFDPPPLPTQDPAFVPKHQPAVSYAGADNPLAKLTDDDIRAIRASDENGIVLGERYGVTKGCISLIRKRKTWDHVEARDGERDPGTHGNAKVDAETVRAIRTAQGSCKAIGERFGVSPMTVSLIRRRKIWKHIPD